MSVDTCLSSMPVGSPVTRMGRDNGVSGRSGRRRSTPAHDFIYLVAVMDWYSRKVLVWRLSKTMTADFCVAALQEALALRIARDLQYRSREPVYQRGVYRHTQGRRGDYQHGREGHWMDNVSSSGCGGASSTKRSTSEPTTRSAKREPASVGIPTSTTAGAPIRSLSDRP